MITLHLLSWATHLHKQNNLQNSQHENLLQDVQQIFFKTKKREDKSELKWVKRIKKEIIIQDQGRHNSLSTKQISTDLELNPSYLSREFKIF
jgi:AraC-like DNA-binding protein